MPSEAATVNAAGMEAENTNDVPLMRCGKPLVVFGVHTAMITHLVIHDDVGASTESTCRSKACCTRPDKHVHLGRLGDALVWD